MLVRFKDPLLRVHSASKVDTLGTGLFLLGLALMAETIKDALLLLITYLFVLVGSATNGFLIGSYI